jgi:hypothetical protein
VGSSQPPLKKKKAASGGASAGQGAGKSSKAAAAAASSGSKKPRAEIAAPKKEPIIVAELAEVFGSGTIDVYKEAYNNCYVYIDECGNEEDDSADMDELLQGWEKGTWKK